MALLPNVEETSWSQIKNRPPADDVIILWVGRYLPSDLYKYPEINVQHLHPAKPSSQQIMSMDTPEYEKMLGFKKEPILSWLREYQGKNVIFASNGSLNMFRTALTKWLRSVLPNHSYLWG